MEKKPGFGKKLDSFFAGKGFYIVLFLCVAVIGVSAWIMFGGKGSTVDNGAGSGLVAANSPLPSGAPAFGENYPDDHGNAGTALIPAEPAVTPAATDTPVPETPAVAPEETPAVPVVAQPAYVWPVIGETERPYSVDYPIYDPTMADWRTHSGIDIDAALGDQVMAVSAGKVERVYNDDLMGTTVIIDHGGGLKSVYSNLAATPTVVEGDGVTAGMIIGAVGDTAIGETGEASHLHFAMTQDGQPVDPAKYLP